jgi:hypothetical protein
LSYVVAAWASCAALLGLYALRTLRRERLLSRTISKDDTR